MKVGDDPMVIEYNCRMGDPETEVVLPRIESDILDLFSGVAHGTLASKEIDVTKKAAVTIVIASGGYPDRFEKGKEITGLDKVKDSIVFQAGTIEVMGKIITSGGRVLAVTSLGKDIPEALSISNKNAKLISFDRKYFRKDIGWEFI
jgi:phosphoribosylamine--glycine ligase